MISDYGTNDHAVDGTAAATFQGWLGNLLDAINIADSTIRCWVLSPLLRNDAFENAGLDAIRTAYGTVCTARASYATHIAGKTILSHPGDFDDDVHPNDAGHINLNTALAAVIYP